MANNLLSFDPAPTVTVAGVQLRTDARGRYRLADLHAASGGNDKDRPAFWLRNAKTVELIDELDRCADSHTAQKSVNVVNGGPDSGTYVCRELVYSYAMWISPAFHVKVIRAYDSLATGGKDAITEWLNKPKSELFRLLGDQSETIERQEIIIAKKTARIESQIDELEAQDQRIFQQAKTIKAQQPKVDIVDKYIEQDNSDIGFREAAMRLGVKENQFRAFLLDVGIYRRLDGRIMPYKDYLNAGYFVMKLGERKDNGIAYSQARFTPKGITWLIPQLEAYKKAA
jgi:phage antirepressor YoqD-like protein